MVERWAALDKRYYLVSNVIYFFWGNADTNLVIIMKDDERGAFLGGDLYGDPRKWEAVKGFGEHYAEDDGLINQWIDEYRNLWDKADSGDESAKKKIQDYYHAIERGWYIIK